MKDPFKTPLDMDDAANSHPIQDTKARKRLAMYLEIIPLAMITGALVLRHLGSAYWIEVLLAGGLLAAVLYLLFSWYLFSTGDYRIGEVVLSVLSGLIFAFGIVGLLLRMKNIESGEWLLQLGLNGGIGLLVVSCALFLLNIGNERAAVFYRNLLARIMIFLAILLSMFMNL